jgi:hypothetical protein
MQVDAKEPVVFLTGVEFLPLNTFEIKRIELTNWPSAWVPPDFKRIEGKEFDSSKEDYWLFCFSVVSL